MTREEAREQFSEAFEGELSGERLAAFEEVLGADETLRAEYDEFRKTMEGMRSLAAAPPAPNLLPGVQQKLRQRSRGRYYRDRFAERGRAHRLTMPLLIGLLMLLLLGVTWFSLYLASTGR